MLVVDTKENEYDIWLKYGSQVKRAREWRRNVKQTKEEMIVGRDEF